MYESAEALAAQVRERLGEACASCTVHVGQVTVEVPRKAATGVLRALPSP